MKGFFAYTEASRTVVDAIEGSVELSRDKPLVLQPWKHLAIPGFKVDDLIREKIADSDLLVADITIPNHNVFYEIGYAIGVRKPVIPTVNTAIREAVETVQKLGLFDTIGWATYNNSSELSNKLDNWKSFIWSNNYAKDRDYVQPLFILDTLIKTDFRNHIFHAVKNSRVNFRSFDPTEVPRLSAAQAISEVSSSAGVIVTVLQEEIVDYERNNLRASFLLGLCHGYDIEALAIQYENGPAPVDYRDFMSNSTYRMETEKHVGDYCSDTLIRNQQTSARDRRTSTGILSQIDLGSPTAENETQQLKFYFVKTAEFYRALRAEGAVVTGRKGAGKSAVFIQVAEAALRDKSVCMVDLRPASHNLSEMRQALLDVLSAGVFDHTIAAFWQYILYVEILLEIRKMTLPRSKNDFSLQERIRNMEDEFALSDSIVSGDFTSRLNTAVKEVVRITKEIREPIELRSRLTNIMFENPISKLRKAVHGFADQYSYILVLIDDLDKGWPARKVEQHDIVMVRHLIEVLNRVQRDLGRQGTEMKHLLFLRSDIYENLIEATSDRGKYNLIEVDWSDQEQLRHLLKQRVTSNVDPDRTEEAWIAFNQRVGETEDAVGRLIEASLRRPRFLIDLCERTLSFSINRGHNVVDESDVEEGLRQMSLYLVSDFGYEMRDIAGTPEDIFYQFIGVKKVMNQVELNLIIEKGGINLTADEIVNTLLWYGFLGIVGRSGEPVFIYDRAYDFRRLKAEFPSNAEKGVRYVINSAFLRGLS